MGDTRVMFAVVRLSRGQSLASALPSDHIHKGSYMSGAVVNGVCMGLCWEIIEVSIRAT